MRKLALAGLLVLGGCAAAATGADRDTFNTELMSGEWVSRSYDEMSTLGPAVPETESLENGTVALALAQPVAVALVFCEPETRRPVAAIFAPERSDWRNGSNDFDVPIRIRADTGRWQTFHGISLPDNGFQPTGQATNSIGVIDHDALRFGDIIARAKIEIWIDAGGRIHRLLADTQQLVAEALDGCRPGLGPRHDHEARVREPGTVIG